MFGLGKTEIEKLVLKKIDGALADYIQRNSLLDIDFKTHLSKNRKLLKITSVRYKEVKNEGLKETFPKAFEGTSIEWYSVENINNSQILLVPSECVMSRLIPLVYKYFVNNIIDFQLLPEDNGIRSIVVRACAHEAVQTEFDKIVELEIREPSNLKIKKWFASPKIVAHLENDPYKFDGKDAMQKNMIVIDSHFNRWQTMEKARSTLIDRNFSNEQNNLWTGNN